MAVVAWLAFGVSIIALFKVDIKEIFTRLWNRESLFQEGEDKKKIRELEDFNRGLVEFKKRVGESLERETAARERPAAAAPAGSRGHTD